MDEVAVKTAKPLDASKPGLHLDCERQLQEVETSASDVASRRCNECCHGSIRRAVVYYGIELYYVSNHVGTFTVKESVLETHRGDNDGLRNKLVKSARPGSRADGSKMPPVEYRLSS